MALDVYREWLGIKDPERPLNYYQLLRLARFEDDVDKIRAHYRKLNAHVRKFATGEFGKQSQQLLNELARAMLTLTDARRKAEYDASLGREATQRVGRSLEEILVARKILTTEQLAKARQYANVVGVEIRDAVLQQRLATPELVMQAYAESVGLPYVDLREVEIDELLVPKVSALLARQHSLCPVMIDDGQLILASPHVIRPEVEEELRLRLGITVRCALCTPADINEAINKYYPKEAAERELQSRASTPTASAQAASSTSAASPEELKARKRLQWMVPLMAFNFSFLAGVLYRSVLTRGATLGDSLGTGLMVGVPVAVVAFLIVKFRR